MHIKEYRKKSSFCNIFTLQSPTPFYLLLKHPQKFPVLPFVLLFGNTFALTAIELFEVLPLQEHPLSLLLLVGQLVLIVNKSFSTPLHPLLLIVNKFPLSLLEHPPCN